MGKRRGGLCTPGARAPATVSAAQRMSRRYNSKRVASRPSPADWGDDELLTLAEASELLWPDGPIVTATLRTAARDGILGIAQIAGKLFTTKAQLAAMCRCAPLIAKERETGKRHETPRVLSREEARQLIDTGTVARST